MATTKVGTKTVTTRARKVGTKWKGQYQFGTYWFDAKRGTRTLHYGSPEAARLAAAKACPKRSMPGTW